MINFVSLPLPLPLRKIHCYVLPSYQGKWWSSPLLVQISEQFYLKRLPEFSNDRFVTVQVLSLISLFCIIASYMYLPYCSACTDGFKEALDYADANINQLSYKNDVNFMGDLNTNLGSSGRLLASTTANKQGRILLHYLHKWKYASVHLHTCSTPHSHTYHSEAHGGVTCN